MLHPKSASLLVAVLLTALCFSMQTLAQTIPLPEHPRPDFERSDWQNLNGTWQFRFDKENSGMKSNWQSDDAEFTEEIMVPFPWGLAIYGERFGRYPIDPTIVFTLK
ncbi:hypothetical protein [Novipirellula artificiosorum]|uniref:Beta-glucuronidase n=1 Tax=Novipirellula artificiosorum TaxID=2528016 RepID=A0A5C6DCK9_9BACT|nr:hypothetical protein [Novipirellula artificiosorum]TWU34963.1 hypothetical protein Poly41_41070 [Novipirellula artificiosorum]